MASASAVEWTATVAMPSSLQARRTRSAISPRLAIRILSNRGGGVIHSMISSGSPYSTGWPSSTRISVTLPDARRRDLVHRLHRLDDEERLALAHRVADLDEGLAARLGARDRRCRPSARGPRRDDRPPRPAAAATAPPAGGRRGDCATGIAMRRRLQRSGDADAGVLALDLDLAQAGLGEELGELADQVLVDDLLLVGHRASISRRLGRSACLQRIERQHVARGPKPADHARRHRRHIGMMAERLAGEDVGEMDLDHRHGRRRGSRRGGRSRCGYRRRG